MSRYFGLGYPGSATGIAAAKKVRDESQIQKDGSKWRGGDRRWGRSLMDRAELERQALDYAGKYTASDDQPGVYNLKVVGDDGNTAVKGAMINIGGRFFKSSEADGRLRILDSEYLNSEISAYKELRDYEETIVQSILVSDETARLIIGGSMGDVKVLLQKGGGSGNIKVDQLKGSGIDVSALPSEIRYLDPSGSPYAQAIAKLRVIVHALGIIVNEEGGKLSKVGSGIKESSNSGNDA